MDPGVPLAFAAGVLSFTSPCCLPLLPGYLGFVSGLPMAGEVDRQWPRTLLGAGLFVLGFALVFTALGASASLLGGLVLQHRAVLLRFSGALVLVMGASMLAGTYIPFLVRERRFDLARMRRGPAGAFPLGMAFAVGWTPCVGPVLAGVLTYAAATGSLGKGTGLLLAYSLGLGLPFIAVALLYGRATRSCGWLRRHGGLVTRLGGGILVAMGVLLMTGGWTALFAPLLRWYARLDWPPI